MARPRITSHQSPVTSHQSPVTTFGKSPVNPFASPRFNLMTHQQRINQLLFLFILALAFALRLFRLEDANIWWDEGWALLGARMTPLEIVEWTSRDTHPPLYFWLLSYWRLLVGEGEFAVRFLSVIFGTLTVAALWDLGRLLWPSRRWLPLAGALLLAMSRFNIWWSQEARMYMLGGLLVTLSLAFMVRLRWQPSAFALIGYLLVTAAALYTLYLLAFLLVIEGLYWLWSLQEEKKWQKQGLLLLKWAVLQVIVLAAFAPWLLYALSRMNSWSVQAPFEVSVYLELYATLLITGISTNIELYRVPVMAVMGLMGVGLLLGSRLEQGSGERGEQGLGERREQGSGERRERGEQGLGKRGEQGWGERRGQKRALSLLLLMLVIPPLVVWGLATLPRSFGYLPRPQARYLLPFAPTFYLLLAWSLESLVRSLISRAAKINYGTRARLILCNSLLFLLIALSAWSLDSYYENRYLPDDYKSIALTLEAHRQPNDMVVLHSDDPWPLFSYHFAYEWPEHWVGTPHLQEAEPSSADYFLSPQWEAHDALWLVINEDGLRVDPNHYFEAWLAERAVARHEWRFGEKRLLLFAKTEERSRADTLLALAPDFIPRSPPGGRVASDKLTLIGWEQPLHRIRAGEMLHGAAYIERQQSGGMLELWLSHFPERQSQIEIPVGEGVVRLPFSLFIPPEAKGERAQIELRLAGKESTISGIQLIASQSSALTTEISPQYPMNATFGEPAMIKLLGYDLNPSEKEAENLQLTLYWQALSTPLVSYKVFTHLQNSDGQVVTQRDNYPASGTRLTTSWRVGETIIDHYDIPLKTVPEGSYRLVTGFYDPTTGIRLQPVKNETEGVLTALEGQVMLGNVMLPFRDVRE